MSRDQADAYLCMAFQLRDLRQVQRVRRQSRQFRDGEGVNEIAASSRNKLRLYGIGLAYAVLQNDATDPILVFLPGESLQNLPFPRGVSRMQTRVSGMNLILRVPVEKHGGRAAGAVHEARKLSSLPGQGQGQGRQIHGFNLLREDFHCMHRSDCESLLVQEYKLAGRNPLYVQIVQPQKRRFLARGFLGADRSRRHPRPEPPQEGPKSDRADSHSRGRIQTQEPLDCLLTRLDHAELLWDP